MNRTKQAQIVSVPSPIGGLNGRDAIANMSPTDAVIMENWFPRASYVELRGGSDAWATGITGDVNTLASYNGATTEKLFAAVGTNIYDVTTQGAVGAAAVTGLTSSKFQWCQMGTVGGQFLLMFNGADSARYFDGTNWITVTLGAGAQQIANVNPNSIINCNIYKKRLFLVEKNTANVWYLPINSIYGSASKLDFSSLLRKGGTIVAMTSWTVDNAGGMQEYAVFISSNGEVVVYQGADPSSATDWELTAIFTIGKPAGYRCFEKFGSDVVIMCADGAIPLSKSLLTDRTQENIAVSDKISQLLGNDYSIYSQNFGWQVLLYIEGDKILINVPQIENNVQYQYVMNIITGAWSKFTGWNANCFGKLGANLFYGGKNGVFRCDYGKSDQGASISATCISAFNYFGGAFEKLFTMMRPIINSNAAIQPSMAINVDFDTTKPTNAISFSNTNYTPWGSPWGSPWSSPNLIRKDWQSVNGYGFAGAVAISVNSKNAVIQWQATDIVFKAGQTL